MDELHLWYLGDPAQPRHVGQLRLVTRFNSASLEYAASWLEAGFALSEDLPLIDGEQIPRWKDVAVGAVDDARPDRWGERVIRYIDKPARLSMMEFLFYAGDDRFGALGVSTSATRYDPRQSGPLPKLADAQHLSDIVKKINAKEPVTKIEQIMIARGGSFGGAKPKALIGIGGVQWVIKFFNNEHVDLPLVEHATMTLAAKAGITVAQTQPIDLAGEHAVAIRRFDRNGPMRVHCISAGTALRAQTPAGQDPDFSYPALAQMLRRAGVQDDDANLRDMRELFRRMVFNILMDNTDDHEKNHTVQVVNPGQHAKYRLAPGYDIVPTLSSQGYQQFGVGEQGRDSTLGNAMSQSELFGLSKDDAVREVQQVIDVVDIWKQHFRECGVADIDIEDMARQIDEGPPGDERKSFDAKTYVERKRRRRPSPFSVQSE
jgi:serine/threonine-protein kinase HipA